VPRSIPMIPAKVIVKRLKKRNNEILICLLYSYDIKVLMYRTKLEYKNLYSDIKTVYIFKIIRDGNQL